MSGIDWPGLMRVGMVHLGLAPDAFWRLTPAELALLTGPEPAGAPCTRRHLDAMARAFPDVVRGDDADERDRDAGRADCGA